MISSTRFRALSAQCWKWVRQEDYEPDNDAKRGAVPPAPIEHDEVVARPASKPLARVGDFWGLDRLAARGQRAPSWVTKH